MLPLLRSDDVLFFSRANLSKIRINDLVMVKMARIIFTHRIIYKTEKYFITKGDNNIQSDGKIYTAQLLGKVKKIKRKGLFLIPEYLYLFQSSLYFQEIVKIKEHFEREQVNHVFLKGLPLHLYYEKAHPRRIYADCDILVNYSDFERIDKILISFGYNNYDSSYSSFHKKLKNKPTETQYTKVINGFHVIFDVHFEVNFLMNQLGKLDDLYSQRLIDEFTQESIETSKSITVNKRKFLILSPELLIIYLALHLFHHNFRGAYRYDFLDKVIRKARITNYELRIMGEINKFKLQNFVYPVFYFLKKYYNIPLSKEFMESIKPDNIRLEYIKKNILSINIFDDEYRIQAGVSRFKNLFFLSPNPLWRRLMIIFNIQVFYSVFWVITFFARRSFMRILKSLSAFFSLIPYRLTRADKI